MSNTQTQIKNVQRVHLFYFLTAVCAVCIAAYLYLVGSIIFNIVDRKYTESAVLDMTTEVGELEVQYLSLLESVDESYARELGFVEPEQMYFASPTTTVVRNYVLTTNEI